MGEKRFNIRPTHTRRNHRMQKNFSNRNHRDRKSLEKLKHSKRQTVESTQKRVESKDVLKKKNDEQKTPPS